MRVLRPGRTDPTARHHRSRSRSPEPRLGLDGVVLTMFDARTHLSADVAAEARRHLGETVYETVIPRSVRLSEAPSHGMSIAAYRPIPLARSPTDAWPRNSEPGRVDPTWAPRDPSSRSRSRLNTRPTRWWWHHRSPGAPDRAWPRPRLAHPAASCRSAGATQRSPSEGSDRTLTSHASGSMTRRLPP